MPLLALLAAAGCEDVTGPGARRDALAGGQEGARTMRVVARGGAVRAEPGQEIDLVVTRPVAIPSELQVAWPPAPVIAGDAVRFVRLTIEEPPPDTDGGVTTHRYELVARRPGTARVTLEPLPASPAAALPPVVLEVTVRPADAAGPDDPAPLPLPELVRRLVTTVGTSPATPLEIARAFGEIESDSKGGVYVQPADPRLKRVIVVKRRATGELNDVQLQLSAPGALTVAELEALWGTPGQPPTLSIDTTQLVFRPPVAEGARYRAVVSLTLDGDATGPVTWVDVIRDVP